MKFSAATDSGNLGEVKTNVNLVGKLKGRLYGGGNGQRKNILIFFRVFIVAKWQRFPKKRSNLEGGTKEMDEVRKRGNRKGMTSSTTTPIGDLDT